MLGSFHSKDKTLTVSHNALNVQYNYCLSYTKIYGLDWMLMMCISFPVHVLYYKHEV